MFGGIAKTLFGSSNDRYVKSLKPTVAKIAAFEPASPALGLTGQPLDCAGVPRDGRYTIDTPA